MNKRVLAAYARARALGLRARAETAAVSTEELLKALGVYYGVTTLFVAFMTTEDTSAKLPVYEPPQTAAEIIEIGLTPEYATGQLNASDNVIRDSSLVTRYTVRLNAARLVPALRRRLIGRLDSGNGLEVVGDNTEGPLCAIGYAANRDDGTRQMRWLLKGRFKEMSITDKTRERGTIAYVTPVLEGSFVPLDTECTVGGKTTRPILVEGDTSTGGTSMTFESFFAAVQLPSVGAAGV